MPHAWKSQITCKTTLRTISSNVYYAPPPPAPSLAHAHTLTRHLYAQLTNNNLINQHRHHHLPVWSGERRSAAESNASKTRWALLPTVVDRLVVHHVGPLDFRSLGCKVALVLHYMLDMYYIYVYCLAILYVLYIYIILDVYVFGCIYPYDTGHV